VRVRVKERVISLELKLIECDKHQQHDGHEEGDGHGMSVGSNLEDEVVMHSSNDEKRKRRLFSDGWLEHN
jgi:hypothetical protein